MSVVHSDYQAAQAALYGIGGGVVLACWEGDAAVRAMPRVEGEALPAPILSLSVATSWGGSRSLVAFRRPKRAARIAFVTGEGSEVASATPAASLPRPSASLLLDGLRPGEQVRAVRFLLQSCRAAFGLGTHPIFVQLCGELVRDLLPTPGRLAARLDATDGLVLCEGRLSDSFGRVADVVLIGEAAVRRNRHLPDIGADGDFRLMLDADALDRRQMVVLLGEQALACRSVDLAKPRPRLLRWLETARPSHSLREYVGACLALAGQDDAAAAAALRELQLLFPLVKAGVTTRTKPVGCEVELALAEGADGLFVSGWLHDPHALVDGITAVSATGRRTLLNAPLHRFPRADVAQHYGAGGGDAGFATYVPAGGGSFQHRFELALKSGEILHVVAPPQPQSFAEARNAVLGSMPPPFLSKAALADCIAPAAAALHGRAMAEKGVADIVDFGVPPARPNVSVVVPLYKVLDFLRFQIAAFAVDPTMAQAELIYVLDSPEQRGEVEHLLRGLHALYGVPLRLAVMTANYGFAAASNEGAALARAPKILFLNSDVIPDRGGWLPVLSAALDGNPRLAAVGPKLLFDDESLQHAGMHFARDLTGEWYNLHFFKGLPRDFIPACVTRLVPAVTGACVLVRRALIERLGGFSEDFIIGDYEDSDLCLRLRQAGHEIGYVPQAELYHLERQSINKHAGYTRGVACAYNRRLHALRWDGLMAELSGERAPAQAEAPKAAAPKRRRKVAA
jgi:GT2 family glycosyltransferase